MGNRWCMNKIYKLTESLINGNELDGSDIGKETLYAQEGKVKYLHKCRYYQY